MQNQMLSYSPIYRSLIASNFDLHPTILFVRRALGDYIFEQFIAMKKQEWDDYRIQVTPYEIKKFLSVV